MPRRQPPALERSARLTLLATVALATSAILGSCGKDSPTQPPPPPVPAHIVVLDGDGQTGTVATELPLPITVRVTTDAGVGMRGVVVAFQVTAGAGHFSAASATTDSAGKATVRWTLGTSSTTPQRGEASVAGSGGTVLQATLTATAQPGPAASVAAAAGDSQVGEAGVPLAAPAKAKVTDSYGNPVPNVIVAWTVAGGGGSVSAALDTSDAAGAVSTTWTLGPRLDTLQVLRAAAGTLPSAEFTATAQLPLSATLTLTAGDAQHAVVATAAAESLAVTVKLADGRPAVGVPVAWAPSAGTTSPSTSATDASGVARTRWTAGIHASAAAVTASVAGVTAIPAVRFSFTADPDAPATVERTSGDGQEAVAATALAQPLVARIVDQYGNAVPGATVAWTPSAGTASPTSSSADSAGRAATSWTLGTRAGTQSVVAAVSGRSGAITTTWSANAMHAAADTVVLSADSLRFGVLGRAATLVAHVADRYGNVIAAPQLSWRSLDTAIAAVAASGTPRQATVQPASNGATRLVATASDGGGAPSDTVMVTVRQVIVSVNVTPANDSVEATDSIPLTAAAFDSTSIRVDDAAFTWASQDPSRATVGAAGLVLALDTGRVVIIASTAGLSATSSLRVLPEPLRASSVAAGSYHECIVAVDGNSYCWGDAAVGQLGRTVSTAGCLEPGRICDPRPGIVPGGLAFTSLAGSDATTCGLTADGQAYCWGSNRWGQLGNGSADSGYVAHETPAPVSTSARFTRLVLGSTHACGLTATGLVYCWGGNEFGQLGVGDSTRRLTPQLVSVGASVMQIGAGGSFTCALTTAGAAYCWGRNNYGSVGDSTGTGNRATPTRVAGGHSYTQLAVGGAHSCAIGTDALVYCWGDSGTAGGVDNWSWLPYPQPISHQLSGGARFTQLAAGLYHTCGISSDGGTYCWGRNDDYQLGNRDYSGGTTPVLVEGGRRFVEITSHLNSRVTCGRTARNAVYCWGWNQYGQLGDIAGTTVRSASPIVIARPK